MLLASTSAGRSPTPSSYDGERAAHGQGADHAGGPVAGGDRRDRGGARAAGAEPDDGRALRPRDDRRDERPARGARRAHGADRDRGLHRPARDRPPGPAEPLPPLRAEAGAAGSAGACAFAVAERTGPEGVDRGARPTRRSSGSSPRCAELERRGGRDLPALLLPRPAPTSGASPSACARRSRASTSPPRTRCSPQFREYERCSTTVIDAYLSPLLGRYLGRLGASAARSAALPEPVVMRSSGGVAPLAEAARGGRLERALAARPAGPSAPGCSRAASGDGDVARPRHGRDLVRRLRGRGRRGAAHRLARDRRPGRSSCRWSTSTRSAPAAARSRWRDRGGALRVGPRSAGAEPGPACYGRGGTEPTVTDANLAARLSRRRLAAGRRRRARPRRRRARGRPRSPASSGSARSRPPRGSSASPTARWCGRCASSRSSAASTRAIRADAVRRRRADARRRDRRRARDRRGSSARAPAACSRRSASSPRSAAATPPGP